MKTLLISCFVLAILIFGFGQNFSPDFVEAAVGDVCAVPTDCFQPSNCFRGVCTGPCVSSPVCQTASFLSATGWANGVCSSDVCVEASPQSVPTGPTTGAEFINIVENITDWLFIGLLILAVVFFILAGFQFLTQGGDPSAMSQARQKLVWMVVAIIVATLAKAIPTAISSITGG